MSDNPNTSNNSDSPIRAMGLPIPLTDEQRIAKQKKFIKAYRDVGVIKYACKVAGINRSTYYYWYTHDADFKAQMPDAKVEANETLEEMAYEQARGMEEPALSMGKIVYEEIPVLDADGNQTFNKNGHPIMKRGKMVMVKKYSPSLLQTLLKANMPEKYKDKVDVTSTSTITHHGELILNTRDMTNEELATLKQLAKSMQAREENKQ